MNAKLTSYHIHKQVLWLIVLPIALFLAWPAPAYADGPVFTDSGQNIGFSDSRDVALGDLDGDGDLDAVIANSSSQAGLIWLNNGLGVFSDSGQTLNTGSVVDLGDLDGDGDLDIALGTHIWINDGAGIFTDDGQPFGSGAAVALGDLDGDGDLDGFIARYWRLVPPFSGENQVWLNDGNGVFSDSGERLSIYNDPNTELEYGDSYAVSLGDLDGDGDLDAFVGNNQRLPSEFLNPDPEYNQVWLNNGNATFDPGWTQTSSQSKSRAVSLGDINNDGDLDVFVGNSFGTNNVWRNSNATPGTFTLSQSLGGSSNTYDVVMADLDRDGDLDAFVANHSGEGNTVWVNNGSGSFSDSGQTLGNSNSNAVALGDLDGDMDLDAFVANSDNQANKVWLNNGGNIFGDVPQDIDAGSIREVALGDINNDGYLDAFVAGYYSPSTIWFNNGSGILLDSGQTLGDGASGYLIALGDLNADGSLDAVVGTDTGSNNSVWLNNGSGSLTESSQVLSTTSVADIALGDLDSDDDLDLFMVNNGPDLIWLNDGLGNFSLIAQVLDNLETKAVALGDLDGDGDLDAFMANDDLGGFSWVTNRIWFNTGQATFVLGKQEIGQSQSGSVALGDVDGDGDLDAFVGNDWSEANQLWLNNGLGIFSHAQTMGSARTRSVALGDLDGDGDLDAVAGNALINGSGITTTVWLNTGQGVFVRNSEIPMDVVYNGLALGDLDSDGDLDVFMPDDILDPSQVYYNLTTNVTGYEISLQKPGLTGDANFYSSPHIISDRIIPVTYTVSHANNQPVGHIAGYYSLNGGGKWLPAVATNTTIANLSTSPGGDTHVYYWDAFASGLFGQYNNLSFRLVAYPQPIPRGIPGTTFYVDDIPNLYPYPSFSTQTFPFRVQGTQVQVFSGTISRGNEAENAIVYRLPAGKLSGAFALADQNGLPYHTNSQGYLAGQGEIFPGDTLYALLPVSSTVSTAGSVVFDGEDDYIEVADAPELNLGQGAGKTWTISLWYRAEGTSTSPQALLGKRVSNSSNTDYMLFSEGNGLIWGTGPAADTCAWLRIAEPEREAWHHIAATLESTGPQSGTKSIYVDGVLVDSCSYQQKAPATIEPLKIGTAGINTPFYKGQLDEVAIFSEALTETQIIEIMNQGLSGAEAGLVGYWDFDEGSQTTAYDQSANANHGILQGAIWEGVSLGGYTVYHTNGDVLQQTRANWDGYTVSQPGVQVITVSQESPLILFDLNVSLEWDASGDEQFMQSLRDDLHRASEVLFDASNGQAALGKLSIYHNREQWPNAHIRVYASNALRPNATLGGIRTDVYSEVVTSNPYAISGTLPYTLSYGPGVVRMGSVWNRFGEAEGTIGEDWPRTLVHELGHYLFYLDEDYLGLNEQGLAVSVAGCTNSVMANPYREDYSEFHPATAWAVDCSATLQAQQNEVSDWQTIVKWYPWLKGDINNSGPSILPVAVTEIEEIAPTSNPTPTLKVPIFYLSDETGASYQPDSKAQAILYQGTELIDLGSPNRDKVRSWGARVGDRLCVYEVSASRLGCEQISSGDEHLKMVIKPNWQPEIIITPLSSQTIALSVTIPLSQNQSLQAQLYPANSPATAIITLNTTNLTNIYSGVISLNIPSAEGYVQVWVDEPDEADNPRREAITAYALGGNPGFRNDGWGFRNDGWGFRNDGWGFRNDGWGFRNDGFAPTISTDGQVILFGNVEFAVGQFYALQKTANLPTPPVGRSIIGSGYRLIASPNAPGFEGTSFNWRYLGKAVPASEESFLSLYHWDGSEWHKLPTTLNPEFNEASAESNGPGLYALMSSIEIALYGPGWNNVAYPVQESRVVSEALLAISGYYTTVYGYVPTDTVAPWRVYDVTAPAWVNDLTHLHFGQGYWIQVSQAITLYLQGASQGKQSPSLQSPPSTFYGAISAGPGITPTVGMILTAWVNGRLCGQTTTQEVNDEIGYAIKVNADGPGGAQGCGSEGDTITFRLNNHFLNPTASWDNNQLWHLNLQLVTTSFNYLPIIIK